MDDDSAPSTSLSGCCETTPLVFRVDSRLHTLEWDIGNITVSERTRVDIWVYTLTAEFEDRPPCLLTYDTFDAMKKCKGGVQLPREIGACGETVIFEMMLVGMNGVQRRFFCRHEFAARGNILFISFFLSRFHVANLLYNCQIAGFSLICTVEIMLLVLLRCFRKVCTSCATAFFPVGY
jgi:hypothetical protein